MRFRGRCYLAHDPLWSFMPLSGDGAAATGGRFNRKGEQALYLSLDVITCVGERTQGLSNRLLPLTICEYDVDCENVVDLRNDALRARLVITLDELRCPWLTFQLAGKQAPSWLVADRLKALGSSGIVVQSFAPGASGSNLVLWRWGPNLPHKIEVYDPAGRLPRNQLSWQL